MSPPATDKIRRRCGWIAALLIGLAAVWLHFHFLAHAGGLWRDEVNLVNLANSPSLADLSKDSFPALMPLLVRVWSAIGFGGGDLGLRGLGLLIGVGLVGSLFAAAWVMRRSPPLLGLVLVGLNSTAIVFGDSLRAYGLGSLLIVLVAVAVWALLKKASAARAALAGALMILSVQALYQNAVFVAALAIGAWTVCWRRRDGRLAVQIFLAALVAALSLMPYLPQLLAVNDSAAGLRTGFQPDIALTNLSTAAGFPMAMCLQIWGLLALAVIITGLATLRRQTNPRDKSAAGVCPDDLRLFAGVALLAGVLGFAGFLWWAALPTQVWYFLPLIAFVAAFLDGGLPDLHRFIRAGVLGFVVVMAGMGALLSEKNVRFRLTNVDLIAHRIAAEASPEDYVVVTPWFCGISFDRYFQSPPAWTALPPLTDHSRHRYDLIRQQIQNTNAIQPVLEKIQAVLQSGHRVWIVGWMDIVEPGGPPPGDFPPAPRRFTGWSEIPYSLNWAAKVAHLLANHSRQFQRLGGIATDNVNSDEAMALFMASGWKSSASHGSTNSPPTGL